MLVIICSPWSLQKSWYYEYCVLLNNPFSNNQLEAYCWFNRCFVILLILVYEKFFTILLNEFWYPISFWSPFSCLCNSCNPLSSLQYFLINTVCAIDNHFSCVCHSKGLCFWIFSSRTTFVPSNVLYFPYIVLIV